MQTMLEKCADRLNGLDEASLEGLWEHYHRKVRDYEPTHDWERAVLILNMIQAVRWKNRLFNYNLLAGEAKKDASHPLSRMVEKRDNVDSLWPLDDFLTGKRGKILAFRASESDESG